MAGNRDLSGGAFGPGVRPYTQADADSWTKRNVPAAMRRDGPAPDRRMDVIRSGVNRTQTMQQGQARGTAAAGAPKASGTPSIDGSYQSNINVGGGIGRGGVLSGLLDTGAPANPNVAAFGRATAMNDASQIGRAIDAQNQQLFMDQQAKRAESTTQGASNLAQIYGDYAERGNAQIGLAAQIMQNNIGFAAGMSRLQNRSGFGALSSMHPFQAPST